MTTSQKILYKEVNVLKKNKLLIIILVFSLLLNFTLLYINIKNFNSSKEVKKVWNQTTSNALFLYKQYDEMNIYEAYDFASGEISTIINVISYINYGGQNSLSNFQLSELSMFYQNLIYHSDIMKQHISEIINIVQMLQDEDVNAFIKIKELRETVELESNP